MSVESSQGYTFTRARFHSGNGVEENESLASEQSAQSEAEVEAEEVDSAPTPPLLPPQVR